jgi:hypothetical protein
LFFDGSRVKFLITAPSSSRTHPQVVGDEDTPADVDPAESDMVETAGVAQGHRAVRCSRLLTADVFAARIL